MNALAERLSNTRERIAWLRVLLASSLVLPALLLFWPGSMAAHAQGGDNPVTDPAIPFPPAAADLKFEHLTTEQGLSNNRVVSIFQDSTGFLWFGTFDGLNRYDGYEFRVFRHDPEDENSLSANFVQVIYEDQAGSAWIGTIGGGLNRFDPETERFTHYRHDPEDPNSLSSDRVFAIYQDRGGDVWIGTGGGGLNRYDPETDGFIRYQNDPEDPNSLSHNTVRTILEDSEGALWIGTDGGGLNRFDRQGEQFVAYRHDPNDPDSLAHDSIVAMLADHTGTLWLGLWGGGLDRFDPETEDGQVGRFTHYRHDPEDPSSLSHNTVFTLYEDPAGGLWIGTGGGGLNWFDPGTEQFSHFQSNPDDPHSLNHTSIISMYADPTGLLWLGTSGGGVDKLDLERKAFRHYRSIPGDPNSLNSNDVMGMYEDREGVLWIGTGSGGLNQVDRQSEQVGHYVYDPGDPHSLSDNMVREIVQDEEGRLWLPTRAGLNRFDPQTEQFTAYRHDPADRSGLLNDNVMTAYQGEDGTLWIGTWSGLNHMDPHTGEIVAYPGDTNDLDGLRGVTVISIHEEQTGVFWLGTFGDGLIRFDPKTGRISHFGHDADDPNSLADNTVYDIHEDSGGILWLATPAGLDRLDRDTEQFVHYGDKDGLPPAGVASILEDDLPAEQGGPNLWISTSKGLSRFNPQMGAVRNYDVSDGLQGNDFVWGSAFKSKDGELFFGGTNGLTAFFPSQIVDSPYIPPVVITDFQLANKSVEVGEDSVLKQSIIGTEQLTLSYQDRVLSFEFSALNYRAPQRNRYRYTLEGFDEEWTEVGSDRRFVTYTNLDPGDYVFRVLGSNNDGVWNEQGTSIKITLTPPWWQTWWFRGAGGLLLVGLVTGGFVWQHQTARRRQHQLERLVSERTLELQDAEAQTRTLVESAPLGIGLATQEGEILSVNPAMLQITGYSEEEMLGSNVTNLYQHPEQREVLVQQLLIGEPVRNFGVELKRKDGSSFDASLTASVISREGQDLLLVVLQDVSEQVRAEQALRESEALKAERAAVDAERSRLARDLHDSATQALYGALLFSATGKKLADAGNLESADYYQSRVSQVVRQALKEMRLLVFELRPPELEREGLVGALRLRLDTVENRSGVEARLHADDLPPLPGKVSEGLYRIALEALNNTLKHAQADTVTIQLGFEGEVVTQEVIDDGQGFDPDAVQEGGLGLVSMQERADSLGADLSIDSAPGQGTRVRVTLEFV